MTEVEYKSLVAVLEEARRKLSATPRTEIEARALALRAHKQAETAVREAKEALKLEHTRRNFAGLDNGPLYLACVEQLDDATVAKLETRALEIQTERERASAARRAAKSAAAPAAPAPAVLIPTVFSAPAAKRGEVEVIVRRAAREP